MQVLLLHRDPAAGFTPCSPVKTLPGSCPRSLPQSHPPEPHTPETPKSRGGGRDRDGAAWGDGLAGHGAGLAGSLLLRGMARGVARCVLQVLTQVSTSQASLIWQELEAEEQELQLEVPQRPTRNSWRPRGQKQSPGTPQHPDEGCVRYFVLATTAAIVALFLNVFYPLIYQPRWR